MPVENAPINWPLLDDQTRTEGLKMKIAKSPSASHLDDARRDRQIAAGLVQAAMHDLDEAASFGPPAPMAQGAAALSPEDLAR
jgi:hypothetical protein